jgi:polysaccharide export outer membrane protein
MRSFRFLLAVGAFLLAALGAVAPQSAWAQGKVFNERLGPGDLIRLFVYKSPDLSAEFRIQESGRVSLPLVGPLMLSGNTIPEAEKLLSEALITGGFLQAPQVSISVISARRAQAVVLGNVAKPGPVPLEYLNTRLSDVLAAVGGIAPTGSDDVVVTGQREGAPYRRVINVAKALAQGDREADVVIQGGDVIYVQRAPVFYAYGEVQKPGSYRLEDRMTVQQALVTAGGLSKRASEERIRLQRRKADNLVDELSPRLTDILQPDDVLFVRESLF